MPEDPQEDARRPTAPMTPVTECRVGAVVLDRPGERLDAEREQEGEREDDGGVAEGEPEADRERLLRAVVSSASSLRVVLSTAAMWSASKACRSPNV